MNILASLHFAVPVGVGPERPGCGRVATWVSRSYRHASSRLRTLRGSVAHGRFDLSQSAKLLLTGDPLQGLGVPSPACRQLFRRLQPLPHRPDERRSVVAINDAVVEG